ncbi:sugar transferase [Enteractinococcus fodinae]|nr:sugar transferase [Enteractinococcus fodinae]
MKVYRRFYASVKRGLDIVSSAAALVALSPIIGAVGVAVRMKLGTPVIFRQDRPGLNGEIFTLYKFRSMLNVDESVGRVANEDRMTPFGSKLRATSLDELPSLYNVLRGDMSLVGPRPLRVEYLERYTDDQARRHEVKPGVTGLAQIQGRNELSWSERFKLDVEYVDNRSLLLDIKIILKTVFVAIKREGITAEGAVVGDYFWGSSPDSEAQIPVQSSQEQR